MKLLRIIAKDLPRFNEYLDLSFYGQKVAAENRKGQLFDADGKVKLNSIEIFVGDTASGKTLILKVIQFVIDVLNNEHLNYIKSGTILCGAEKVELDIFFLDNREMICYLHAEIAGAEKKNGEYTYRFLREEFYEKPLQSVKTAKDFEDFRGVEPICVRNNDNPYLPDDVSIVIAHNKKDQDFIENYGLLSPDMCAASLWNSENILEKIIRNFDSSIEKINFERISRNRLLHLKFHGENELVLRNAHEMDKYLSRGTINGAAIFQMAEDALETGGYLLIDDIEYYLSRKNTIQLISLFQNSQLNRQKSVLIVTTKWPEFIDACEQKDTIHITRLLKKVGSIWKIRSRSLSEEYADRGRMAMSLKMVAELLKEELAWMEWQLLAMRKTIPCSSSETI